jgi:hypothetical protein
LSADFLPELCLAGEVGAKFWFAESADHYNYGSGLFWVGGGPGQQRG